MTDPRLQSPPDINALTDHYTAKAVKAGVPEHLVDGLVLYIVRGVLPGGFLYAVLSNNLVEALGRADHSSRAGLFELVSFIYNDCPAQCWHSPEMIGQWAEAGGMVGVQS